MYRFALAMTPDDVEAVAAQLYVEMLEAGYARSGSSITSTTPRTARPMRTSPKWRSGSPRGGGDRHRTLTLLPVFYAHAGFGGAAAAPEQRRFGQTSSQLRRLVADCRRALGQAKRPSASRHTG